MITTNCCLLPSNQTFNMINAVEWLPGQQTTLAAIPRRNIHPHATSSEGDEIKAKLLRLQQFSAQKYLKHHNYGILDDFPHQ